MYLFYVLCGFDCRITSRYPDDPRQPFWNDTGAPMKPLAKLTLTRQRLYKKSCGLDEVPFQETASAALAEYEREGGDQQNGNSTLLWQTYSKKDDDRERKLLNIPFNFPLYHISMTFLIYTKFFRGITESVVKVRFRVKILQGFWLAFRICSILGAF